MLLKRFIKKLTSLFIFAAPLTTLYDNSRSVEAAPRSSLTQIGASMEKNAYSHFPSIQQDNSVKGTVLIKCFIIKTLK